MSEETCRTCGEANDDGEGWDGLCGACADRAFQPLKCKICGEQVEDEDWAMRQHLQDHTDAQLAAQFERVWDEDGKAIENS